MTDPSTAYAGILAGVVSLATIGVVVAAFRPEDLAAAITIMSAWLIVIAMCGASLVVDGLITRRRRRLPMARIVLRRGGKSP